MGQLVGDLAVLAREGEGPAPESTRVDLGEVVEEVVSDARAIDRSRSIDLDVAGPMPVRGHRGHLEQLVHNLVGNALIHTPAGSPVEVELGIRADPEGDWVVLVVRDHGPGLTPEQADRVFDRFYRASTLRDGGSGLGLFIVATLARGFGGTATVESVPGEGSAFTVVLPLDAGGPNRGELLAGADPEVSTSGDDPALPDPMDAGTRPTGAPGPFSTRR